MSEDSGNASELLPCALDYLRSLHTDPDEFARRYPHTYAAFAALTCDQIEVLKTIGAALAEDAPKGDHHSAGADVVEDTDTADGAAEKLQKYLMAIH
jgi:hypothetical protein